jgi:uncharacterized membrane protein YeaQ/YmgE (transglycosylase-associated protein family)
MNIALLILLGIICSLFVLFMNPKPLKGRILGELMVGISGAISGGLIALSFFSLRQNATNTEFYTFSLAILFSFILIFASNLVKE